MDYWKHEKAILAWAYSQYHQHLGNRIDSGRIKEIYGFDEIVKNRGNDSQKEYKGPYKKEAGRGYYIFKERSEKKNEQEYPFKTRSEILNCTVKNELPIPNSSELLDDMLDSFGDKIVPIMGNLVQKGLAIPLRRSDNTSVIESIMISRKGILVGEIVMKGLPKILLEHWRSTIFILFLLLLSLCILVTTAINNINDLIPNKQEESNTGVDYTCMKCRKENVEKSTKKIKGNLNVFTKCNKCGYIDKYTFGSYKKKKDPNFVRDRDKYCMTDPSITLRIKGEGREFMDFYYSPKESVKRREKVHDR